MNIVTLFDQLPLATIVAWILAQAAPYLSALLTSSPGWLTGALTLLFTAVDGFVAEWVRAGDNFDFTAAAGTALGAWIIAVIHHSKILSGTETERNLYAVGSRSERHVA